jgi:predicted glutamine amidotransferase
MCDLFGLSCNEEDRATKSLPKFAHQFGTEEAGNNNGWGIAYFDKTKSNKGIVERASDGSEFEAAKSKEFFEVVDEALSTNIIAHVRNASPGTGVCTECLIHNLKEFFAFRSLKLASIRSSFYNTFV